MPDIPSMSDEVKNELIKREAHFAAEDIVREIRPGMKALTECIEKFEADPDNNGLVAFILISLTLDSMMRSTSAAVERFRRRVPDLDA